MKLPQSLWRSIYRFIKEMGHIRARRAQGLWY